MKKRILALAAIASLAAGSLFASGSGKIWPDKSGIVNPSSENPGVVVNPSPENPVGAGLEFREENGRILILQNQKAQIVIQDNLIKFPWEILKKIMIIRDNFEIVVNDDIVVKVPFKLLKDRGLLVKDNFIVIPILGNPDLPILDNGIIRLPILGNGSGDDLSIIISPVQDGKLIAGAGDNSGAPEKLLK